MSKFKVGDRVATYSYDGRQIGEVSAITESGQLKVTYDYGFESYLCWHPKQCRKLIKKKRMSIWVDVNHAHDVQEKGNLLVSSRVAEIAGRKKTAGMIEFIEVRRK